MEFLIREGEEAELNKEVKLGNEATAISFATWRTGLWRKDSWDRANGIDPLPLFFYSAYTEV